jgi:hypothetical protein
MANLPFDRVVWNPLEKALSTDWNLNTSESDRSLRDTMLALMGFRGSAFDGTNLAAGFVADGFKVIPGGGMNVTVSYGLGFFENTASVKIGVGGVSGLNDLSDYSPIVLSNTAGITFAITTPAASTERYDLIEAKIDRRTVNGTTPVLDPSTGIFGTGTNIKELTYAVDNDYGIVTNPAASTAGLSLKRGTPAAFGSAGIPGITPGYVAIAYIKVNALTVSVTGVNISDVRPIIFTHGSFDVTAKFRITDAGSTYTLSQGEIFAPPGIDATVVIPDNSKFNVTMYIKAGYINGATQLLRIASVNTSITPASVLTPVFVSFVNAPGGVYQVLANPFIPSAQQLNISAGTPSMSVGQNQDLLQCQVIGGVPTLGYSELLATNWPSDLGAYADVYITARVVRVSQ